MSQNVYFDEAGFTGNNLLDPQQSIFAYASVLVGRPGEFSLATAHTRFCAASGRRHQNGSGGNAIGRTFSPQ